MSTKKEFQKKILKINKETMLNYPGVTQERDIKQKKVTKREKDQKLEFFVKNKLSNKNVKAEIAKPILFFVCESWTVTSIEMRLITKKIEGNKQKDNIKIKRSQEPIDYLDRERTDETVVQNLLK